MVNDYNKHKITQGTVLKDTVGSFEYKVKLSPNIEITDEGYLIARNAVVGNVGELQYSERELGWSNSTNKVSVLREEADVFDEISLSSLEAKPITILHPKGNVDSENVRDLGKGTVLGVPKRDGDNMVVDIVVQDKEAVDLIAPEDENGIRKLNDNFRDLSLGYKAKLVEIALGLYKQTEIRYNHLALVPQGRQANATIVDHLNEDLIKGVIPKMSIIDKIFRKGKKVVRDENGEIKITNEEVELLLDEEEEKVEENKTQFAEEDKKEQVEDQDEKEKKDVVENKENIEKTEEVMEKDKKYFQDKLVELNALPDGVIKADALRELEKEFLDAFPQPKVEVKELKDSLEPVETKVLNQTIKDEKPQVKELRFNEVVKAKADYYNKLTNPFMHDSWKEFDENYSKENRNGASQYVGI